MERNSLNAKITSRDLNLAFLLAYLAIKTPQVLDAMSSQQTGPDGGYYLSLAMNIRDGLGFVTNVSPFNQGLATLPHYSSVYPIWPILLGYAGRIFDIEILAHALPAAIHFLSIPLAYILGRKLFPNLEWSVPRTNIRFNAGHLLGALFALNLRLAHYTVLPYTESIAWLLMAAFLLRAQGLLQKRAIIDSVEFGLWIGLLFLVRSQFILAAVALLGCLTLEPLIAQRTRHNTLKNFRFLLLSFTVAALVCLPHLTAIANFAQDGAFWSYMRFDQIQGTRVLPQLRPMVETHGMGEWLMDRGRGLLVSLGIIQGGSFFSSFGLAAISIHLALLSLFFVPMRRRGATLRNETLCWLRVHPWNLYFTIIAMTMWLSLYTIHLKYWGGWPFSARQGFAAVFAIFLGWGLLLNGLKSGRVKKALVVALVLAQISLAHRWIDKTEEHLSASPFPELGSTLERLIPNARVTLPGDEGKQISPWARSIGFHQFFDGSKLEVLACMKKNLGVGYFLYPIAKKGAPDLPESLGLTIPLEDGIQEVKDWRLVRIPKIEHLCKRNPNQS
jgi:hypothetical protein